MAQSHQIKSVVATGENPGEGSLIDVRQIFFVLWERRLGALILTLLTSGLLAWILLRQTPVYATEARLLVERSSDRVVDIKQVVDNSVDSSLTDALLLTHIQQIRSHTFLTRAVVSLTESERAAILAPYPEKGKASDEPEPAIADGNARVEELIAKNLNVERSGRTLLITVGMRHRDPAVAQLLANCLVEEYIAFLIDRSSASNDSALVFLNKQAEELRRRVETAEGTVQDYREKHNLFFMEQSQNIVSERLKALSTAATQARVRRLALDAHVEQAEKIAESASDARSLASLPEFSAFASVQRQIDELRAKRDVLTKRYGGKHPVMLENATTLETLEGLRRQQIDAALSDLRNQRGKAASDEQQLNLELADAEKESLRFDQLSVNYNFLRREVDTTRETYAQILARLNETTISSRLQNTNIKFVDRAVRPIRPIEPNRLKVLAMVFGFGGLIFLGYPLVADKFDTRLKSWSDVSEFLDAPLLGEIHAFKGGTEQSRASIVTQGLDEEIAEEFRTLYNQIQFSSKVSGAKTILVTSTLPSEGKSFVVANLGASFAAHGHRTLLVDADFRRANLHRAFRVSNDHGILSWLALGIKPDERTLTDPSLGITEVSPGLFLLPPGGESRKLTELLRRGHASALIRFLQQHFDLILLDTSPAGVFPDAEACSSLAAEFFYVCRFAGPDRVHARQTLDRLRKREPAFLGVVLNAMSPSYFARHNLSGWGRGRQHHKHYYSRRR